MQMRMRKWFAILTFIGVAYVGFTALEALTRLLGLSDYSREIVYDFHRDELRNSITPFGIASLLLPLMLAGAAAVLVVGDQPEQKNVEQFFRWLAFAVALLVLGGVHQIIFGLSLSPSIGSMVSEIGTYLVSFMVMALIPLRMSDG